MEQIAFNIYKEESGVKLQIGDSIIGVDDNERLRLLNVFTSIRDTDVIFPSGMQGTCLMYDNGIIAVIISLAKLNTSGTKYLLFAHHMLPESTEYIASTYMLVDEILDRYINELSE